MTAKDKAEYLVKRYSCLHHGIDENTLASVVISNYAIQSALIAVDEILDRLMWHTGASDLGNTIIVEDIRYLMDVKHEIEKL